MAGISFIEDGKELLNDLEDKIGKKGVVLLLGGLGLGGLYLAYKSFKTQPATDVEVPATGYIGYPEAEENADVIISELTGEITGSGSSLMSMFEQYQSNILGEIEDLRQDTNTKFENLEQIKGEAVNKENSNLTNGTVGGDFVNTDKGTIKDTTTAEATKDVAKEVVTEVPVTPNYAEGSGAQKFHEFREEVSGKSNYTQLKGETYAGQVYNDREWKENEYGGKTIVNEYQGTTTITKLDAQGHTMSKEQIPTSDIIGEGNSMISTVHRK